MSKYVCAIYYNILTSYFNLLICADQNRTGDLLTFLVSTLPCWATATWSIWCFSRLSGIRTHTFRILSAMPLPVGLPIDQCILVVAREGFEPTRPFGPVLLRHRCLASSSTWPKFTRCSAARNFLSCLLDLNQLTHHFQWKYYPFESCCMHLFSLRPRTWT